MSSNSEEFENAKSKLNTLSEVNNDAKLKLYGLFKQATVGNCNTSKPSRFDLVGSAKWNAWNKLKNVSKKEAEKKYIDYVNQLLKSIPNNSNSKIDNQEVSNNQTNDNKVIANNKNKEIITSIVFDCVYKIVLNRPNKFNAINLEMRNELLLALKEADENPNVTLCCITGNGTYFSSGNDLSNFISSSANDNIDSKLNIYGQMVEDVVNSFINFSKPLIALVNGPAIGISCTLLALYDLVIASDKATFWTPFTPSALSPEGCSSYTFPKLMGNIKAADVLLFNKKLTAQDALNCGLVSEVIPDDSFQQKAWQKIEEFTKFSKNSLIESKRFIRGFEKQTLLDVNKKEIELLKKRLLTGEYMQQIEFFMNRKSKL